MKKQTPRQRLEELEKLNGNEGFYGLHNQFAEQIRHNIDETTRKLLGQIFNGVLPRSERLEYMRIREMLLDGKSMKAIKQHYKG